MTAPVAPDIATRMTQVIGSDAAVHWFRAPGRINLMGDHTDYNGGMVLPIAIEQQCVIAARHADGSDAIEVTSLNVSREADTVRLTLDGDPAGTTPPWGRYVAAVATELRALGTQLAPVRAVIHSTVPPGSGLSSSAALEVACAVCLSELAGAPALSTVELALLGQRAEQRATGVPCGVMDQLASAAGRSGQAMVIDCASNDVSYFPLPDNLTAVAVHSGVERQLENTAYAERRATCEALAAQMGLRFLCEATPEQVAHEPVGRHVVSEHRRVSETARALAEGDTDRLSALFADSHASLRDDFAVSTPELDLLVQLLLDAGAVGARLTGAGFGGCVAALVHSDRAEETAASAAAEYQSRTGLIPAVYVSRPAKGAGVLSPG